MQQDINPLSWNSPEEFEVIYHQYFTGMLAYALKFVNEQVAEDIVQEIFATIWNKPPGLKTSLKSYLYAAVRNASLDYLKNLKVKERYAIQRLIQLRIDEIEYYDTQAESLLEKEQYDLIHAAIGELPAKCREIFEMSYYQDMKSAEIAEKLQISVRTVQNQLYKGLIQLKKSVQQHILLISMAFFIRMRKGYI